MKTVLVVARERHIGRLIEVNLQRAGYSVSQLDFDKATPSRLDQENPELLFLPPELLPSPLWSRHSTIEIGRGDFQLWRKHDTQT